MADIRQKTISYLRAIWLNPTPSSRPLESYLREATKNLKSVSERTVERDNGQNLRIVGHRESVGHVLIHVTADTPGEHASIVPNAVAGSVDVRITTVPPPNDAEYMAGLFNAL
jgi:hypothetical protein